MASWTFLRKVRENGAGAAGRRTNPEAAEEPELLSCDAEGLEGSERRRGGGRRPSEVTQTGVFLTLIGKLQGGVSCLGFPNRKGETDKVSHISFMFNFCSIFFDLVPLRGKS